MPYVATRLGRLFYESHGHEKRAGDPAIVLLHGLLFDGSMWRGQVEPLSLLGRVLVFDGFGHGKSDVTSFMLEEHADALLEAFDTLGVKRAMIVGLSWGGMLGMRIALRNPERLVGLVLLDTSADRETWLGRLRYRAFVVMHEAVGMSFRVFSSLIAPVIFAPRTIREHPEIVNAMYRRAAGFVPRGIGRAGLAVVVTRTVLSDDQLRTIALPTLVLCGKEDAATTPDKSERIARAIPGARLAFIDGVGHSSVVEDPAAVNAHLVPFVADTLAATK